MALVRKHFNAFMRVPHEFARYPRRLANCIRDLEEHELSVPPVLLEARRIARNQGNDVQPHGNVEKFPDRRQMLLHLAVWMARIEIANGSAPKSAFGAAADWVNTDPTPIPSLDERAQDETYDPNDRIVIDECLALAGFFGPSTSFERLISDNMVRRACYEARRCLNNATGRDSISYNSAASRMLAITTNLRPKESKSRRI